MELYHSGASPFVRKVMVVLHETGQLADVKLHTLTTNYLDSHPDLVAASPLARLPTMIDETGQSLSDSRVICRYLDERAQAGLYPTDARKWPSMVLESMADGVMDSAVAMAYEVRLRPEGQAWDTFLEAQWTKVVRTLADLEANWADHLAGPLDIGQIGVGAMLGYLDLRHGARDWRADAPALAAWYAEFSARPSMQATAPV